MELIERPNLDAVKYLNSISLQTFRNDCLQDAELKGEKPPTDKDMKTWHSILKQFCKTNLKTKGITKRIYSYSLTTPTGLGGRLFGGGSMQGIWSVYRGLLMKGRATDIDMKNCHPVLLRYICNKHDIDCPSLEYYINNRDKCLSQFASKEIGKNAYLVATNSDKYSKRPDAPEQFKRYDREMKDIQKKLVALPDYKDIVECIPEYKLTKNFNGSVINRILCKYENDVLQEAIHVINKRGLEIAILMFDGLMIYGDHYDNAGLLNEIEEYVESKFQGLNMKWAYKEHDDTLDVPDEFDSSTGDEFRHANDDTEASRFIIKDLEGKLKYSNHRIFINDNNIWISDEAKVKNFLFVFILNSNIKKLTPKGDWVSYAQNNKSAKSIAECVVDIVEQETISNDEFYNKLHSTTKGRLCFKDGVLDFASKMFYKWGSIPFEYYSPMMIQTEYADYFTNPDRKLSNHILQKVFTPLFGDKTSIALQFLSRAIAGHSEDKNWGNLIGNRDCGKGVIYDGLKNAFGDYVDNFELAHFLYQRDREDITEVSRKMYWVIPLEFSRIAISQEVPKYNSGLLFNGKMMKKLQGGGDPIKARRNYDRRDTMCILDTVFFIMGNDALKCVDEDVFEHCMEISSSLQFKTQREIDHIKETESNPLMWEGLYVADPELKTKIKTPEWSRAIITLLFDYYSTTKVSILREVQDSDENTLRSRLLHAYEITKNLTDVVPVKEVAEYLSESTRKVATELLQLGVEKKKCKNRGEYRDMVCFHGLKRVSINAVSCDLGNSLDEGDTL